MWKKSLQRHNILVMPSFSVHPSVDCIYIIDRKNFFIRNNRFHFFLWDKVVPKYDKITKCCGITWYVLGIEANIIFVKFFQNTSKTTENKKVTGQVLEGRKMFHLLIKKGQKRDLYHSYTTNSGWDIAVQNFAVFCF